MPIASLTIGPAHTLTVDTTYALPTRRTLCHVQTLGGIEQSNTDTWPGQAVTLDDDEQFEAGAAFIRATGSDAIVTLKAS